MIFSLIVKVTPMVKIQSSGPVTVLWNQIILFFDIQTGWNVSHCLNGTHHPKGRPAPSSHHHWGLPAAKLLYTNVLESFTTCSRLLNRSKFLFSLKSTVNTFPPAPNKANAYYKYAITQISYYSHWAWSSYPKLKLGVGQRSHWSSHCQNAVLGPVASALPGTMLKRQLLRVPPTSQPCWIWRWSPAI